MAKRLYGRWFCTSTSHPLTRVFPYDGFDALTEAPQNGQTGKAVLLRSLNGNKAVRESGLKWAWCWSCGDFVQSYRRSQYDIALEYVLRPGIRIRSKSKATTTLAREVVRHMQDRERKAG